jgi:beta-lactamase regulating signal transducer with metallopeptidase domain
MKIRVLTVLSLAAFLLMVGCRGAANTNTANGNMMNSNSTANSMMNTTSAPMADSATKATVESALAKAGITGVMVDATTAGITLRGTVAKGKMAEAVRVAQESGKKAVKNELTEK